MNRKNQETGKVQSQPGVKGVAKITVNKPSSRPSRRRLRPVRRLEHFMLLLILNWSALAPACRINFATPQALPALPYNQPSK